ncbi:MAG: hypothetical protein II399_01430 [Lachnospiraceae bacterium]|nr:hypothetical protein [Lachnospiraceae bacterium]
MKKILSTASIDRLDRVIKFFENIRFLFPLPMLLGILVGTRYDFWACFVLGIMASVAYIGLIEVVLLILNVIQYIKINIWIKNYERLH